MTHEFESGLFYQEAAWHRLGTVVDEWPSGGWDEACRIAGLTWEVEGAPLTMPVFTGDTTAHQLRQAHVNGYQAVIRNDKPLYRETDMGLVVNSDALLGVQPSSYKIINNRQFGDVIEHIVGKVGDDWQYETLISLSGGRLVICLLKARQPLHIAPDPSKTFVFLALTIRHDGQGGLRGTPTNVRVVCRNTHNAAEMQSKRDGVGFTIKHTTSWEQRVDAASAVIAAAVKEGKVWESIASKLGMRRLVPAQRDRMLASLFRTDSSMTPKQQTGVLANREAIIDILASKTCDGIDRTMLGFVQAVDEWCDHVRPARSDETRTTRSLLRAEPIKIRALVLARGAADR